MEACDNSGVGLLGVGNDYIGFLAVHGGGWALLLGVDRGRRDKNIGRLRGRNRKGWNMLFWVAANGEW